MIWFKAHLDWEISSVAQISNAHGQVFSAVEPLTFKHEVHLKSTMMTTRSSGARESFGPLLYEKLEKILEAQTQEDKSEEDLEGFQR